MHTQDSQDNEHGCPHCGRAGSAGEEDSGTARIEGWPLGLASACVFLTPLICALLGVVLFRHLNVSELLGGALGFFAGLGAAMLLARMFKREKV